MLRMPSVCMALFPAVGSKSCCYPASCQLQFRTATPEPLSPLSCNHHLDTSCLPASQKHSPRIASSTAPAAVLSYKSLSGLPTVSSSKLLSPLQHCLPFVAHCPTTCTPLPPPGLLTIGSCKLLRLLCTHVVCSLVLLKPGRLLLQVDKGHAHRVPWLEKGVTSKTVVVAAVVAACAAAVAVL
jgi:hypothetical protein